jgi:hypothetical protein
MVLKKEHPMKKSIYLSAVCLLLTAFTAWADADTLLTEHLIQEEFNGACCIAACDFDGDLDIDLVATASDGNQVFTMHIIKEQFNGARSVNLMDVENDGDTDILAVAWQGAVASWFENDGNRSFTEKVFCEAAFDMLKLFPVDLDRDGDKDIVGSCYGDDEIRWWENGLYGIRFSGIPNSGHAPLTVGFSDLSAFASPVTYRAWDLDGDGSVDSQEPSVAWTYTDPGSYTVSLDVRTAGLVRTLTIDRFVGIFDGESGLEFDGLGSQANVPASPALNLTQSFTLEIWLFPFSYGESPVAGSLSMACTPAVSIHTGEWQHVAVTYDGAGALKAYINGLEQPLSVVAVPNGVVQDNSGIPLLIGNSASFASGAFNGIIDEVRIWNSVRPGDDILACMDHYLAVPQDGLMGYWQMNEGYGPEAVDLSGNGNSGVLSGALWCQGKNLLPLVGEEEKPNAAHSTALSVWPNPFVTEFVVEGQLADNEYIDLALYDLQGVLAKKVLNGNMKKGKFRLNCHAGHLPPGIYYLLLRTDGAAEGIKLVKAMD